MKVDVMDYELSIKPGKLGYRAVITKAGTTFLKEYKYFPSERDAWIYASSEIKIMSEQAAEAE